MKSIRFLFLILAIGQTRAWSPGDSQPHIVFMLADDLGFNDVPWNNDNMIMPNLETYAEKGIILNKFYTQPMCSPSRAALMSGYYPIHNGFNNGALSMQTKNGLDPKYETLPEALEDLNYDSYMVGKWHLGSCKSEYLPHHRGFISFDGILHSGTDHYEYTKTLDDETGYDLHSNDDINLEPKGNYSEFFYGDKAVEIIENHDDSKPMFLYMAMQNIHGPVEAPSDYTSLYTIQQAKGLIDKNRRKIGGMASVLDDVFQQVVDALETKGILSETVIIFASDNGGQADAGASNYPLRGGKKTLWEGGVRVPSFIYSELFSSDMLEQTNDCLFHMTDWYTSILKMAGSSDSFDALDGVDQWDTLSNGGSECQRDSVLLNILDDGDDWEAAIRVGNYKLFWNNATSSSLDGWYYTDGTSDEPDELYEYNLFDLDDDPNETNNLAYNESFSDILDDLKDEILSYVDGIVGFETSGKCDTSEVIVDGYFTIDCCEGE